MRWWWFGLAVLGALLLAVLGSALGTSTPWSVSLIGLGGGAMLILGPKLLGSRWLRRDERYYDQVAARLPWSDPEERPR